MSIHSGSSTLNSRSNTVEITTTLFELMEVMDASAAGTSRSHLPEAGQKQADPDQDRLIAMTIANMFLSGKIRFKHPRDIKKTFPEWFD